LTLPSYETVTNLNISHSVYQKEIPTMAHTEKTSNERNERMSAQKLKKKTKYNQAENIFS